MSSHHSGVSGGGSNNPLSEKYTKDLAPVDAVATYPLDQLRDFVESVELEVALLAEERATLASHQHHLREGEARGRGMGRGEDDDGVENPMATHPSAAAPSGGGGVVKRRGQMHRRKSEEERALILTVEDKKGIAALELERLRAQRADVEREVEEEKEMFRAAVEEAINRSKEVSMEHHYFTREVTGEKGVSADKVVKYFTERPVELRKYLQKTREKAEQARKQVQKSNQQLRQREDVGEAFHKIDFSQLEIENHQFLERIEQKNEELVELKGTTTRTVQTLNGLTDKLGSLTAQQVSRRKDLKLRQEHVDKLTNEIELVKKEGATAQKKNTALKIQHESVKVPKVEDYIAQKAEVYELQKAVQNWKRKVEIASGHVAVMKQQMLSLRKKLGLSSQAIV